MGYDEAMKRHNVVHSYWAMNERMRHRHKRIEPHGAPADQWLRWQEYRDACHNALYDEYRAALQAVTKESKP